MKYNIFFLILLFCAWNVMADEPEVPAKTTAIVSGKVISGNEVIPFATVLLKGTTIGTSADATGNFTLSNLPAGPQVLIVTAVGYKSYLHELFLKENTKTIVISELEPDNIGIEQVVVSADRNSKNRHRTPTIVNSIGAKLFQRTQSITLSEGLNFSPGLRVENNCQNCGFSQLKMNGLEGPYTQILVNSRPVFSGLAGVYGLDLFPANMIERVEIIRGGGSALYGSNAIAGTVNLITKDPVSKAFSVEKSYGIIGPTYGNPTPDYNLNMNGSFVTNSYKTGLTLFGFYRNRNPFDVNNDGFTELASITNTTIGSRIFQRVANRGKLTFDYFHINEYRRGGNKFELPLHQADISESVDHAINSGAATFDLLMRDADKLSVFFSAQQVNRDSYYGANQDPSAYGNTEDFTFSSGLLYLVQLDYFIIAPASLTSGLEFNGSTLQDHKLGYYDPIEDVHFGSTVIADQNLSSRAGYIQSEWNATKWVFTTGLRYDRYQVTDKTGDSDNITGNVFSPRVSLLFSPSHHWQIRAGLARGFRAPQIFDEDLHIETSGSRKVLHQNDPNLRQETSNSYTASLNHTHSEGKWQYQLLAEGFYTSLINPFANEYGIPDENGVVIYTRTNAEKGATVQGVNLEFNASPSNRLQVQSGFTFQNSFFEEAQEFGEKRFFRSPDKYGYFSLNYSPSMKLSLSGTGNYTGSMLVPYFGPAIENPAEGVLRTSKPFFDAGFKAAYTMRLTDYIKVEWNAGVKNVFNAYQADFDIGINRDPSYIYGPVSPRTIYLGIRIGSLL